jgi:hypothetical protein
VDHNETPRNDSGLITTAGLSCFMRTTCWMAGSGSLTSSVLQQLRTLRAPLAAGGTRILVTPPSRLRGQPAPIHRPAQVPTRVQVYESDGELHNRGPSSTRTIAPVTPSSAGCPVRIEASRVDAASGLAL